MFTIRSVKLPHLSTVFRSCIIILLALLCACLHEPKNAASPGAATKQGEPLDLHRKAVVAGKVGFKALVKSVVEHPISAAERGLALSVFSLETLLLERLDLGAKPDEPPPPLASSPPMDLAAFEKKLDHITGTPRLPARLHFLIDGTHFFRAFENAVREAKQRVDIRVYIFDTDDFSIGIANLLKRRSHEVQVRVLFDVLGTYGASFKKKPPPKGFTSTPDMEDYLRADGSRVEVQSPAGPWLAGSHTKVMLFDGARAFVGGMNIGAEYRYEWHDMMVELTGPLVQTLQDDFDNFWQYNKVGGGVRTLFRKKHTPVQTQAASGEVPVRVLRTRTWIHEIERAQLEAIRSARSYIWIENAYYGDNKILKALVEARNRGVDVRVIVPQKNDTPIMQKGVRLAAAYLLPRGIRVYRYPGMTHVKAAIYDGWAAVGSANFDKLSMKINRELDIAFSDPEMVGKLKKELFEKDFERAKEWRKPPEVTWTDYLSGIIADQL